MTDALRAALRSTTESVVALVVIMGVFSLTGEQVGALMLVVTNLLTLTMFFWKAPPKPADEAAVAAYIKDLALRHGKLTARSIMTGLVSSTIPRDPGFVSRPPEAPHD